VVTRRTGRRVRETPAQTATSALMRSKLRLVGVALVCAKVALVPLLFDTAADFPFVVVKALFSHALAYVTAGILIAMAIRFRGSFLTRSPLHLVVLAFLGVNAVATIFAVDPLLALFGTHGRMLGLGTIADGVILYFGLVLLVRTRSEALAVFAAVLASSLVVLGYELIQLISRDPFKWDQNAALRPFSTVGQTTTLAEYCAVLAVGAVAIAAFANGLSRRLRLGLLLYVGALVSGLVMTQTRSGVIGLAVGGALLVLLTWLGHPDRRTRLISLGGALMGGAVIALVLVATPLGARLLGTVELSASVGGDEATTPRLEQSAQVRVSFYRMALDIVRERPILGYGPDNFVIGVPRYRTDSEPSEVQVSLETSAHGWLSQVAATSGLAGVAAFLGTVLVALILTLRSGFRPAAWIGAGMLAAFLGAGITTVDEVGTDWLLWTSLGIIGAATARPWSVAQALPRPSPGRNSRAPIDDHVVPAVVGFGYVCVGIGVLLALTTVNALGASHSAHASHQERLVGHTQQAIALALSATSADPRRSAYWDTLGLAYISADRATDAVVAFKRASDLAPYDVRYLGDLARGYLELVQKGDSSSAARARDVADRTVTVDPNHPQAQLTRAVVMQVIGDLPEAARSVDRALALDPNSTSPQLYLTATQVYNANGRFADAIAIARKANGILSLPNTVPIRVELARALMGTGQPSQALAELDIALSIRPNDPAALQLRAQIRSGFSSQ